MGVRSRAVAGDVRQLDFLTFSGPAEAMRGAEDQTGNVGAIFQTVVNDVFNRRNQKTISSNSQPFVSVLAANYRIPAVKALWQFL